MPLFYLFIYVCVYTGHTQKNGAVLIVFTIKTAPFFCVCPVYIQDVTCVQLFIKTVLLLLLLLLFTAIKFSPGGNTNGHINIHKNNNTKQTIRNYKTKYIQ
jgi:hypothetical protein